jgi:hypothetical protein
MISRCYIYFLLLHQARPVGGSVEHSEGKGGKNVVAIPMFLCGSPRPCWLRSAPFWPRWQVLSCVLTACQILWGPISRVAFVTTILNRTSLLHVVLLLFGGWMRPRVKTSSRDLGSDFDIVGTCEWLSYVKASGSQVYVVLVRFFLLQGVYRFESPRHSQLWVTACRYTHLVVCLVYCWWIAGVGFGYVQDYDIVMLLLTFDVDMSQRSACFYLF